MYGKIDFKRIDTEPGSKSAFAPPEGWQGDYRQYMRDRWKSDPGARQHIAIVGRMIAKKESVTFCGPFAEEARQIAETVWL